ncbi:putative inorganic phosphate cotransporter isoform X1 [Homalodisca vitripennis]|nr:putative inorganic phosphate cotransporter isoform X1 [Homalodisca vitripennis]
MVGSQEILKEPADFGTLPVIGKRHWQALMTFLSLVIAYSMRVNLSVGIVAMTDNTEANHHIPVLPWDSSTKGIILSSFFWGYLILQIPAGLMSRKFGPKYLLFWATIVCSVLTLLVPYIAENFSWVILCMTRVAMGLVQGAFYPCVNAHTSKWAPPLEKSRIFSFVFIGTQFGTFLTMPIAGYLAASPWGWPSIFYCTGLCGVLWSVAWLFVGADSPDCHPTISDGERHYIVSSLSQVSTENSHFTTPWKSIMTSVPVLALITVHFCQNWGYWMLLTQLPNYLSHVLRFDLKSNGLISSLPYLIMCLLTFVFSWAADYINARRILPLSASRKIWNSLAHCGGAAALVGMSFISSSVTGAVVLLTTSVSLGAGIYMGYLATALDLSPNFSGVLMGIVNCLGNISSFLAPMVTGFIVKDEASRDEWMIAFYISAGIFFVGNLIFIVFGSSDVQPWNNPLHVKT